MNKPKKEEVKTRIWRMAPYFCSIIGFFAGGLLALGWLAIYWVISPKRRHISFHGFQATLFFLLYLLVANLHEFFQGMASDLSLVFALAIFLVNTVIMVNAYFEKKHMIPPFGRLADFLTLTFYGKSKNGVKADKKTNNRDKNNSENKDSWGHRFWHFLPYVPIISFLTGNSVVGVAWLAVVWYAGLRNKLTRFHFFQGSFLFVLAVIFLQVFNFTTGLTSQIAQWMGILTIIVALSVMIAALANYRLTVPLIGSWADTLAKKYHEKDKAQ